MTCQKLWNVLYGYYVWENVKESGVIFGNWLYFGGWKTAPPPRSWVSSEMENPPPLPGHNLFLTLPSTKPAHAAAIHYIHYHYTLLQCIHNPPHIGGGGANFPTGWPHCTRIFGLWPKFFQPLQSFSLIRTLDLGLFLSVHFPTDRGHCLVKLFVSQPIYENIKGIKSSIKTEHSTIVARSDDIIINIIDHNKSKRTCSLRKPTPALNSAFLSRVQTFSWDNVTEIFDIHQATDAFYSSINELLNASFPNKIVSNETHHISRLWSSEWWERKMHTCVKGALSKPMP